MKKLKELVERTCGAIMSQASLAGWLNPEAHEAWVYRKRYLNDQVLLRELRAHFPGVLCVQSLVLSSSNQPASGPYDSQPIQPAIQQRLQLIQSTLTEEDANRIAQTGIPTVINSSTGHPRA